VKLIVKFSINYTNKMSVKAQYNNNGNLKICSIKLNYILCPLEKVKCVKTYQEIIILR
jgi:hypothetical protein